MTPETIIPVSEALSTVQPFVSAPRAQLGNFAHPGTSQGRTRGSTVERAILYRGNRVTKNGLSIYISIYVVILD